MLNLARLKTWHLIHKWTSLICTLFMLLLCITGLPLIFYEEIDHALGYRVEPPVMEETGQRASLAEVVESARQRRPEEVVQFVLRDAHEPDVWFVRLGKTINAAEASSFLTFDARSGELLNDYPLNQGFMNLMLRLHVDMFAGLPGTLFLGFMGLLLAASLISGTVLYAPFMRQLPFGCVRSQRSSRLKWLDLHNLIGIVTLAWFLVVGITGVINTLALPIFSHWQATQLTDMTAPYHDKSPPRQIISAAEALQTARAAEPDKVLSFMAFPGNSFASPHHYTAFMQGREAWSSQLLNPVLIDAENGRLSAKRELPWYVSTLLVSQPLHFGDYGGLPLKVLWAFLDVLTIVVLGSGLYLWIKKRDQAFESWLRMQRLASEYDNAVATTGRRDWRGQPSEDN